MITEVKNLKELRNVLNKLSDDELKQPPRFWGNEIGGKITGIEILKEDYINPSGECVEAISTYLPGGEGYDPDFDVKDEEVVLPQGTVLFCVE